MKFRMLPSYSAAKPAAVLLAAALLMSACGGEKAAQTATTPETSPSASQVAKEEAPLEFSVMTITPSAAPAADDNPIKRAIEKATNSKLKITWVSNNVYTDKLNITLASGDIPDLIMINDPFSTTFRTMVKQGAFWDLTSFIKDYPNLINGIPQVAYETTKQEDGKTYGIPRPRSTDGESFFIIRKDWLDKLGLKPPATTDELLEVMKAFVEKDPDGNGKKDTVALNAYLQASDSNVGPVLNPIESAFTGVNGMWKWNESTQSLQYTNFLPETRKALEYMVDMYKNKLIPEDFLSLKLTQARDLFKANKAGIIVDKTGTMKNIYADELKKVDPGFKYSDFYPLDSINGYNPKGSGYNGILAIPKSVPEQKVKGILKVIDTWMNPEIYNIQKSGLEGVHYKLVDGKKVTDSEKLKSDNASDFNHIVNILNPLEEPVEQTQEEKDAQNNFKKSEDARRDASVPDIAAGLYSPTGQKVLPDLDKKAQDLKAKIILGREPITAWDDFVAKTQKDEQVIKTINELTEAYKKRIGK
jgi:putative aldouronate transport system substrate-binding protein